ncbi:MAG: DM13 domain-containing protein [Acidimicrobiia bacterium]
MSRRTWIVVAVLIAVPVIAVGWWLGSPLFLDTEVNEEFPMSAGAEVPDDMTQEEVEIEMEKAAEQPATAVEDSMPDDGGPTATSRGEFEDFDDFHMGSGTATIYELEDGSHVLRLEDFEVTNGPDLHVLLAPDSNPADRDGVTGYVDLGSLKGNIGDQNYEIPGEVDVGLYGSVVIYCQPFHVIFSVASLS